MEYIMTCPILEEITQREEKLLDQMNAGTFEQRDEFNDEFKIYIQWSDIFLEYTKLGLTGNVEGLKRSLFFIWYNVAEPYQLSGIKHIDTNAAAKVLTMINDIVLEGNMDSELRWMLPYYYTICDYYLSDYTGLDSLINYSQQIEYCSLHNENKNSFQNRGQLGDYWQSIDSNID